MISAPPVVEELDFDVTIVVVIADVFHLQVKLWPGRFFAGDDHRALVHNRPRIVFV